MDRILISIGVCLIQLLFFSSSNIRYVNSEGSEAPFKCEVDGTFPHMNDCSGYYLCKDGELTDKMCPKRTVYDPQKQKCIHFYKKAECKRPNCANDTLQYVPHPGSNKVYVECFNKSPKSLTVCPSGAEYYEKNTPPCGKPCKGEGFFPNEENPVVYYSCMEVASKLRSVGFYCPEKYKLRKIKIGVMCVKKKENDNNN